MLTMKETDARTLRPDAPDEELIRKLKARFQALHEVRRGVCLLNAGKYEDAAAAFSRASVHGGTDGTLASYLAACHMARGNPSAAAEQLAPELDDPETDVVQFIRTALAAWAAEARDDAIRILREGVSNYPESAELHFQLGILLADMDEVEEAELRFVQALNIDRDHRDALVSLAMCCGMRSAPADAVRHLKRAQSRHPRDARIALLLAQAAAAAEQQGHMVSLSAIMPAEDALEEREGIEELARVIADDPDFVDAFISIPVREVDSSVFAVLLRTLETALEHQPEHAELHYHCGQVLARLGRHEEAIDANERAVGLNPRMTRALIDLGKLYHQTDRAMDATDRLEQAVRAGAEYADVFYMLGNLYREQGQLDRARLAYERALTINNHYQDAQRALNALPS